MADRESNFANAFETTLSGDMGPTALTAAVVSTVSGPSSPCYLVIDPDDATKREYIYFDGVFTGTTFVTSNVANRYLAGSAAASGITHLSGAVVRMSPVKQHFDDLHDRISADRSAVTAEIDADVAAHAAAADPHPGYLTEAERQAAYAITAKNMADAPSTYPIGVTHFNAAAAPNGGTGWPASASSAVVTFNYGSSARVIQHNYARNAGSGVNNVFVRGTDGTDGWGPWRQLDDHGGMNGLGDDDHTQYYNAARHTKAVHDALAIDHGSMSGLGDNDHPQYALAADVAALQTPAMVRIEEQVLGSTTASVTFSSIPATYRHLRLLVQARGSVATATTGIYMRVNNDSTASYDFVRVDDAAVAGGTFFIIGSISGASAPSGAAGSAQIDVFDYRGTFRPSYHWQSYALGEQDTANQRTYDGRGQRRSTAAVTALLLYLDTGSFAAGSRFSLYGVM